MPRPPKPGGAVIEPRAYATVPGKFGQTSTPLRPGPVESPQHGAAELQHAITNFIREFLLDRGTSLRRYCETVEMPAGLTYERLSRINSGASMLTLTDLAFWAQRVPDLPDFVAVTMKRLTAP